MKKIIINEKLKRKYDEIAERSIHEAAFFPIDRAFLEPYLSEILEFPLEFVFYNLELVNPTYTNILFLCLPEIWENIDMNDVDVMLANFSNVFSYFTLIEFTYKYLQVDMLEVIVAASNNGGYSGKIKEYLKLQWNVLLLTDDEKEYLRHGFLKFFYSYDEDKWSYIKQRFLIDARNSPSVFEEKYLKSRINHLIDT